MSLRLLFVQAWRHDDLAQQALQQQQDTETIPARPGDILDRNGRLLATTVQTQSLYVDPHHIDSPRELATRLAAVLAVDADQLTDHLTANRERRFLWIKRRLSEDEAEQVLALDLPSNAFGLRPEFQRRYPHRHLAAHVLGWRNIDGVGQQGVERTLQSRLEGVDGSRTLVRDARGFVIDILEEVTHPPIHGRPLTLTLDLELQAFVERQLDRVMSQWQAATASAVVIVPQTGELLAMSSRPTFDPNDPAATPASSWVNRSVSQSCEPGSTLKPIVVAWAIQNRVIERHQRFDCGQGEYRMGTRLLHDSHPHGELDVSGILVKSSNIGMARIGEQLGNERLHSILQTFGFGRCTGIDLPAESPGMLRPLAKWDRYSTGSIPMGQELAATPLQILRAHAALANGGRLITPHLLGHEGSTSATPADVLTMQVLDPSTAAWIRQGPLVEVVNSGTARNAAINNVEVFAKTGTAQIFDPQSGHYSHDRYVSSCLCGAPANHPRALVLVTVCEADAEGVPYGGVVAAPPAAAILERALDVTDRPVIASGERRPGPR